MGKEIEIKDLEMYIIHKPTQQKRRVRDLDLRISYSSVGLFEPIEIRSRRLSLTGYVEEMKVLNSVPLYECQLFIDKNFNNKIYG